VLSEIYRYHPINTLQFGDEDGIRRDPRDVVSRCVSKEKQKVRAVNCPRGTRETRVRSFRVEDFEK